MKTDKIIDQVVQFTQEDEQISVLWLYGSRAKGSAHDRSDYDFAVAFSTFIKAPYESRLRPELLALNWQEACQLPDNKLSVVDINKAPIALAWEILSTGKVLLVKAPIRYHQEFQRITSMTEWVLLKHRKRSCSVADMSPYIMAMRQHLAETSQQLDKLAQQLRQKGRLDKVGYLAVERLMQVSIESAIGLAKRWGQVYDAIPQSSSLHNFAVLRDQDALTLQEYAQWQKIIGMRNILVHRFNEIDR